MSPFEEECSPWWRKGLVGLLMALVVAMLWLLFTPHVIRCGPKATVTHALSDARQIRLALFDFDSEYGRFPDASTIDEVKRRTGSTWDLKAGTSNDLFKQLIVSGIVGSEKIFYAKAPGAIEPDNNISSEAETLKRGECAFAYISGRNTTGSSDAPLLVTPLIPGTLRADPVPFDGKAIILRADNSAVSYPIHPDGRILAPGGDLFDPAQPYWDGVPPVVKWPDLAVSLDDSASRRDFWQAIAMVSVLSVLIGWLVLSIVCDQRNAEKQPESSTEISG